MRVAFLIITYTNPKQTERMIRAMQDEDFDFYLHVDAKFPLSSHDHLSALPNVYFIKNRVDVQWAAFSTIQAEFNSIQEILNTKRTYDYVSLMSGQDYPIKSVEEIKQFFEDRKGKLLLKYRAFEGDWEEAKIRVSRYYFTNYRFFGQNTLERLINKILPERRPLKEGMKFYGSSMFWALTVDVLEYVLQEVDRNKKAKRFYNFTWAPDEFLFQTVILNSKFAGKVINENCHYYKHLPKTPNPKLFELTDLKDILSSDRILARKFDMIKFPEVLDQLDAIIKK